MRASLKRIPLKAASSVQFEVHILGTASATPAFGRNLTAQAVYHNNQLFLVDCGEGTQFQLQRFKIRPRHLKVIFISHLHGDHILGLPGLLGSLNLNGREEPLDLIGPQGLERYLNTTFSLSGTKLGFPLRITALTHPDFREPVWENERMAVFPVPLLHRLPTYGYRFQEKEKPRRFLVRQAEALNIPPNYFKLLKQGNTITLPDGRSIAPDSVLGERPAAHSYAFCSDTAYFEPLVPYIQGVDVLYHEATFQEEHRARAFETLHSTAKDAAHIARQAGVGRLLLGHFSARYPKLEGLLGEAQAVFPAAALAREGDRIDLLARHQPSDEQEASPREEAASSSAELS